MNMPGAVPGLLALVVLVSSAITPWPSGAVETVDLNSVVKEVGIALDFKYELVTGKELEGCEVEWETAQAYGVKNIVKLGGGNLLVIISSDIPRVEAGVMEDTSGYEELVSVFSSTGELLGRMSLGGRWVQKVYQSGDGSLVSIVTGGDNDRAGSIIIDKDGNELFTSNKEVLYPSFDGEYLVSKRLHHRYIEGKYQRDDNGLVKVGRLLNKDGSPRSYRLLDGFEEEKRKVLRVLDNGLLFAGRNDTSGGELPYCLMLYDISKGRVVWEREVAGAPDVMAVSGDGYGRERILLGYSENDRNVRAAVLDENTGELMSEIINGGIFKSIGSEDGFFFSNISGEMKIYILHRE